MSDNIWVAIIYLISLYFDSMKDKRQHIHPISIFGEWQTINIIKPQPNQFAGGHTGFNFPACPSACPYVNGVVSWG